MPVLAVIPHTPDHGLPEEQGWFHPRQSQGAGAADALRRIVVVAYPRISNLDEYTLLSRVPGHQVVWARHAADLAGADLVIMPGSKQVRGDLHWLQARGLDLAVRAHAAARGALLGVCDGLQMLSRTLNDPQGLDRLSGTATGLGLLPLATHYGPDKRVQPATFDFGETAGCWRGLISISARGYEIRRARTALNGAALDAQAVLFDADSHAIGWQRGIELGV